MTRKLVYEAVKQIDIRKFASVSRFPWDEIYVNSRHLEKVYEFKYFSYQMSPRYYGQSTGEYARRGRIA